MTKLTQTTRIGGMILVGWVLGTSLVLAQPKPAPGVPLPLADLSAFKAPSANWRLVGNARADLNKVNVLTTSPGTGVLANVLPGTTSSKPTDQPQNLFTNLQHGDMDLELDYMIAPKSNSGVYLQGRYEIQLFDSWDIRSPRTVDNGSIYERWNEKRPEGKNGYEGHPARQNASRAPGLWQHLKISFQAPRFTTGSAGGSPQKTENARMLLVELNGVVIHEDVELTGPTRAAAFTDEQPLGPLMLQGDHGAVAFRNIQYTIYDKPRPELLNLKYAVYKGKFEKEPDYAKTAPESQGATAVLSPSVSRIPNEFLIRYTGTLRVSEPGEYRFNLDALGGGGMLKINNQLVASPGSGYGHEKGKITLPKGDLPFDFYYTKFIDWAKPAIGLTVAGPGVREFTFSEGNGGNGEEVDPIVVEAPTNTILRSFMDMPGMDMPDASGKRLRVTHAISVGSPEQIHYTYDLDKGALVQVWRGMFLDATPMWHDRGDGSSRPMGMVQRMGTPVLFLSKLASPQATWATDTTGSGYRPKGYVLDESDRPTFRYQSYNGSVDDKIRVLPQGQGIQREVSVTSPAAGLYARLATGATISALENGTYLVDGVEYLRIDEVAGAKPILREVNGRQELIVPVTGKLIYSILF